MYLYIFSTDGGDNSVAVVAITAFSEEEARAEFNDKLTPSSSYTLEYSIEVDGDGQSVGIVYSNYLLPKSK